MLRMLLTDDDYDYDDDVDDVDDDNNDDDDDVDKLKNCIGFKFETYLLSSKTLKID